jgi:membrane associated rhomboid family serine protease
MVFPIHDDNTGRVIVPFVNYALIAINVLVFVFPQELGSNVKFTYAFSCVPYEILSGKDVVTEDTVVEHPLTRQRVVVPGLQPTPWSVYVTLLTSMFMHGGLAHLFGNMLFLWIFGDNVEDSLGHLRYLAFYLVCGLLASLAHILVTVGLTGTESPETLIPSLGASGAISGVLGGYLLLHPQRQVLVFLFRLLVWVPGFVAIGLWFLFQLISGLGMLGAKSAEGGVAYGAHIGGFLAGVALVHVFMLGRPSGPRRARPLQRWAEWRY